MSAALWQATTAMAQLWRDSPIIAEYAHTARSLNQGERIASADHVLAQPLLLGEYLHTVGSFAPMMRYPPFRAWIETGRDIGCWYGILFAWLRSRLTGYPYADTPQLSRNSPWSGLNVSMKTAWPPELLPYRFQDQPDAPPLPFVSADRPRQVALGNELGAAIAASTQASRLDAAWRELDDEDRRELARARVAFDQFRYDPGRGQNDGREDFRQVAWAEAQLDEILRHLGERGRAFAHALDAAEQLVQQASALFSHLVVHGRIRTLGSITYVEQLSGRDGWLSVRSERLMLPFVWTREIVRFDHPYLRGVMMVEGTHEELGHRYAAVTVHGRILPSSADGI